MGRKKKGDGEGDASELRWVLSVLGGSAVLFGLVFGAFHWNALRIDETARSKLLEARRVPIEGGRSAFVLMEEVLHPGGEDMDTVSGRLDLVDAATGARLARVIRADAYGCQPASPGRLWCYERHPTPPHARTLVLRALPSLEVVASAEALEAAVPSLREGISTSAMGPFVDADGGAGVVTTNDGRTWRIAPAGCPAACVTTELLDPRKVARGWDFGRRTDGTVSAGSAAGRSLTFTSGPRRSLAIRETNGSERPVSGETFLDPHLLAETDDKPERPLVLPDPSGGVVVVVHKDSLAYDKAKTHLAAVDLSGNVRWRVELGKGTVAGTWRVTEGDADLLVVAVQDDESSIVAVDPRTGVVRWRYLA